MLTLHDIAELVAHRLGVDLREMRGKRRFQSATKARHVAVYLMRALTGASLNDIGAYFDGRDHSTISNALRSMQREISKGGVYSKVICELTSELTGKESHADTLTEGERMHRHSNGRGHASSRGLRNQGA